MIIHDPPTPWPLGKVVRRVVIADPSCFLPYRAQSPPVCAAPQLSKWTPPLPFWALISRPWIEPNHAKFWVNLRFLWAPNRRSSAWKNRLVFGLVKNHECAFRPRKYTLYVGFHRRNPKFSQSRKTFLGVSLMKMAFQMRFVEAKRKLFMCSCLKRSSMMLRIWLI